MKILKWIPFYLGSDSVWGIEWNFKLNMITVIACGIFSPILYMLLSIPYPMNFGALNHLFLIIYVIIIPSLFVFLLRFLARLIFQNEIRKRIEEKRKDELNNYLGRIENGFGLDIAEIGTLERAALHLSKTEEKYIYDAVADALIKNIGLGRINSEYVKETKMYIKNRFKDSPTMVSCLNDRLINAIFTGLRKNYDSGLNEIANFSLEKITLDVFFRVLAIKDLCKFEMRDEVRIIFASRLMAKLSSITLDLGYSGSLEDLMREMMNILEFSGQIAEK